MVLAALGKVPPGLHQGSTRVPRGSARAVGWREHQTEHRMLLRISPELMFLLFLTCSFLWWELLVAVVVSVLWGACLVQVAPNW